MHARDDKDNETVSFIAARLPGLPAGTYTLTVHQHVTPGAAPEKQYSSTRLFEVKGQRFTIRDAEVHSMFPPPGTQGQYSGCLPQIVFNRAMLPWIRTSSGLAPRQATWLAVLMFDDDGTAPAISKMTVQDLVPANVPISFPGQDAPVSGALNAAYLSYFQDSASTQQCVLEYGETASDIVMAIDVTQQDFLKYAPALADLQWLAHVREVDLADRSASLARGGESSSGDLSLGQFATVLGNRACQEVWNQNGANTAAKKHAMVVSLEGLGDYLRGGAKAGELGGFKYVRLVVLKDWRFATLGLDDKALLTLLEHACDGPDGQVQAALGIPTVVPTKEEAQTALAYELNGTPTADSARVMVRQALAMGYVPLAHDMRTGDKDVSWYRGPFTPLPVTGWNDAPLLSMDKGYRYNPSTGLFDVSYAAAWQLGQLLALTDQSFSRAFYEWRRDVAEQTAAEQDELRAVADRLDRIGAAPDAELPADAVPIAALARVLGKRFLGPAGRGRRRVQTDVAPSVVADWFENLKQFQPIPLRYLIPSPSMLGNNALRFFYLDVNWMNALFDGACSIVRYLGGPPFVAPGRYVQSDQASITGCLINSQAILNWPGLRIEGRDANGQKLSAFDDTLGAGLRLILFQGVIDSLVIYDAGESLHFGGDIDGDNNVSIPLRQLSGIVGTLASGDTVSAVMRDRQAQVIDIDATASAIRSALIADKLYTSSQPYTAAEFALEMVKSSVRVVYQWNQPQD